MTNLPETKADLEDLMASLEPILQARARRYTIDPTLQADLLQEARLAVWEGLMGQGRHPFRPGAASIVTWAFRYYLPAAWEAVAASAGPITLPRELARKARLALAQAYGDEGEAFRILAAMVPEDQARSALAALAPSVGVLEPMPGQERQEGPLLSVEEALPDPNGSPVEDDATTATEAHRLLDTLGPVPRMVMEMTVGLGDHPPMGKAAIAQALGVSEATVARHRRRALARMRTAAGVE